MDPNHPGVQEFLETGTIHPRGGDSSLYEHTMGWLDSKYTSWTTDVDVARYYATDIDTGEVGAILWIDGNSITNPRHSVYEWGSDINPNNWEKEVAIEGSIIGAQLFDR